VIDAGWSSLGGQDCVRLRRAGAGAHVEVVPASARARSATSPTMAGEVLVDGDDLCFVPRFGFVEGTVYAVLADGRRVADLTRPSVVREATTEVVAITPAVACVPRNLLRLHVWFSAPMSEGLAARSVRLEDDRGRRIDHALLVVGDELWDAERRRLTVLLDPARIKRGLVSHRALGYPLERGEGFRVVVDQAFRDAAGAPLRSGASRHFEVGPDERRLVDPLTWRVVAPRCGTADALHVTFDRPLDVALVLRCLAVSDGRHVLNGRSEVAHDGGSWTFVPDRAWPAAAHTLVVDERLEDLAGNSVRRVFDRELTGADPDRVGSPGPVAVAFAPSEDVAGRS
jgi:hypothetical protein